MARILIVDDEPDIVMIAKRTLEGLGHETGEARNGNEALKKLKKERFDLILLDVMMPDDNGWEVCRKIKADEKINDIPVVMFTVRTDADDRKTGKEVGAIAQIDKPFGREELIGTVERVLEGN
jgi:CheY-like chemotaxis protein